MFRYSESSEISVSSLCRMQGFHLGSSCSGINSYQRMACNGIYYYMSNSEVEMNLDGMVSCVYVNVVTHVVSEDVVIQIVTGNFSHKISSPLHADSNI